MLNVSQERPNQHISPTSTSSATPSRYIHSFYDIPSTRSLLKYDVTSSIPKAGHSQGKQAQLVNSGISKALKRSKATQDENVHPVTNQVVKDKNREAFSLAKVDNVLQRHHAIDEEEQKLFTYLFSNDVPGHALYNSKAGVFNKPHPFEHLRAPALANPSNHQGAISRLPRVSTSAGVPKIAQPKEIAEQVKATLAAARQDLDPFRLPSASDIIHDKYCFLTEIASGTFGCVGKVKILEKNGTLAALKFIKREEGFADTYFTELSVFLAVLKSKHNPAKVRFPKFVDTFNHGGFYCIAMELLGITLHEAAKLPSKNMGWVLKVAYQILEAVQYLHGLGFIHGDLKFNNILCIIGSTAFIKVIDYGCSLPYKNQKIFLNYDIGAMPYRVPEVLLQTGITPALDEHTIGTILSELYTGARLYGGVLTEEQLLSAMVARNGLPEGAFAQEAAHCGPGLLKITNGKAKLVNGKASRLPALKDHLRGSTLGNPSEAKAFTKIIESLLQWDPEMRPKAGDLLKKPLFSKVKL